MPVDDRMRAQNQLILDGHRDAAAHPTVDRWDEVDDIEYLYREYAILAREQDAERVAAALGQILDQVGYGDVPEGQAREIQREPITSGLVRLTVPRTPTLVPDLVDRLDEALGPGWQSRNTRSTCARLPARRPSRSRCREPRIPSRPPAWTRAAAAASPGPGTTVTA